MQSNLFVSAMRTLVPLGAGAVLSLSGRLGIPADSETAVIVVYFVLAGAYYLAFRGLEWVAQRLAWQPLQTAAGVLLGWARPPAYEEPVQVPVRLKLDKAAMRADMDEFVRRLGEKLDGQEPR
ncbi:hypothetical protein [Streptomyces sp. TRM68416]|uniref:hypothetical protein n=1 Tax=Streptomyces sp. TRM68416 TaxID=2758412 RepID=UPI001661D9C8|nr:hypothetical protein [Streptomyces sp. TRM68416]MBD0837359.1 hypothetical protein [Streptomyces sp. TRM68416]